MTTGVTVHGRALARTAAVTLDDDTFILPTCDSSGSTATTPDRDTTASTTPGASSVTTTPGGGGGTTDTTTGTGGTTGSRIGDSGSVDATGTSRRPSAPTLARPGGPGGPGVPAVAGAPRTGAAPLPSGRSPWLPMLFAAVAAVAVSVIRLGRADSLESARPSLDEDHLPTGRRPSAGRPPRRSPSRPAGSLDMAHHPTGLRRTGRRPHAGRPSRRSPAVHGWLDVAHRPFGRPRCRGQCQAVAR